MPTHMATQGEARPDPACDQEVAASGLMLELPVYSLLDAKLVEGSPRLPGAVSFGGVCGNCLKRKPYGRERSSEMERGTENRSRSP